MTNKKTAVIEWLFINKARLNKKTGQLSQSVMTFDDREPDRPSTVTPLPAEGDCDETGLCRCGCGLRAGSVSP